MEKIKVLHLIKTLSLGGAEVNLYNLICEAEKENIETHVGYSYGGEIEERFKKSGVKLFKYAKANHKIKSLATFYIVWRLVFYILKNRIQIVHTHNFSAHIWGSLAAKLAGARIVEHVHDFRYLEKAEFEKRHGVNQQYKFAHFLRNVSDRVVVLTRQNSDYLVKQNYYPANRIRKIWNGIPMEDTIVPENPSETNIWEQFGISKDAQVILTSARIAAEKNIDLILKIAPHVLKEVPSAVFVVTGDGPLLKSYQEKVVSMGLEKSVRFIGFCPFVYDLLAKTHIYLLPSFLELHSISILEAMSMKVPVVVSDEVGCNNEFIQTWDNGILLDPFSSEGWAEALITLLKNTTLSHRIGLNGFLTCRSHFDIRDTAKQFKDVYAELASE